MACGCGTNPNTIKSFKASIKSREVRLTELEKFPNLYPASIASLKTELRSLRSKLAARRLRNSRRLVAA